MSISHEHAQDLPAQQGSAGNFIGDVQVHMVAASPDVQAGVGRVTFASRGVRFGTRTSASRPSTSWKVWAGCSSEVNSLWMPRPEI